MRIAPTLHARRGLWSSGFMRVLKIDEFTENDQRLFTQPLALARLGRYLIDMHKVRPARVPSACRIPLLCAAVSAGLLASPRCHTPVCASGFFFVVRQETKKTWVGARSKPLVMQALDAARRVYTVIGLLCSDVKDQREKAYVVVPQFVRSLPLICLFSCYTVCQYATLALCSFVSRNFAKAFRMSADETSAHYTMDSFDASVMEIEQDDVLRFTDFLQVWLARDRLRVACCWCALSCGSCGGL